MVYEGGEHRQCLEGVEIKSILTAAPVHLGQPSECHFISV